MDGADAEVGGEVGVEFGGVDEEFGKVGVEFGLEFSVEVGGVDLR